MATRGRSREAAAEGKARKRPESVSFQVMREERDRLRAIVDAAVDGIIAIDEAGTILELNPAAERIFGYPAHELLGQNVRVLMPQPFRDEHSGYVERFLRTGERRIIGIGREVRGRRKDGSVFPHYLGVAEGRVAGQRVFTGIVRDLGRLREAEERARQAEQLAALSTITAGIAHDVGTPMTTILGYAELLEQSAVDDKSRHRAHHIVDQVRRVTDLLQTLLNIARPRRAEPEPVSIADVLDHSVEFFREKLRGRGIVVERDYAIQPTVVADRDRIEQVFLNLIVNAADAMPDGGTLSVRIERQAPEIVEISIEDTGVGIAAHDLDRIFDAFYTTKERGKGTGLGLLVSQRIVREHGGMLRVESEVGKGTRFMLTLPDAVAGSNATTPGA
jgi:PAS domain S-box-containing protein